MKKYKVLVLLDVDPLSEVVSQGLGLSLLKQWILKMLLNYLTSGQPVGGLNAKQNYVKWGYHFYSSHEPTQLLFRAKSKGFREFSDSSFEEFESALENILKSYNPVSVKHAPPFLLKDGIQSSLVDFQFDQPDVISPVLLTRTSKSKQTEPLNIMYVLTKVPLTESAIELHSKKKFNSKCIDRTFLKSIMLPSCLSEKLFAEMNISLWVVNVDCCVQKSSEIQETWNTMLQNLGGGMICLNKLLFELSDFNHIKSDHLLFKENLGLYLKEIYDHVPASLASNLNYNLTSCPVGYLSKWSVPSCSNSRLICEIKSRQYSQLPPLDLQDKLTTLVSVNDNKVEVKKIDCVDVEMQQSKASRRGLQLLHQSKLAISKKKPSVVLNVCSNSEIDQETMACKSKKREEELKSLREKLTNILGVVDNYKVLAEKLKQVCATDKESDPILLAQTVTSLLLSLIRSQYQSDYKFSDVKEKFFDGIETYFIHLPTNDSQLSDYSEESISQQIRDYQVQVILLLEMLNMCSVHEEKDRLEHKVMKLVTLLSVKSGNVALGQFLGDLVTSYTYSQANMLHEIYEEVNLPLPTLLINGLTPSKLVHESDDSTSVWSEQQSIVSETQSLKETHQPKKLQRHSSFINIQEKKQIAIKRHSTDTELMGKTHAKRKVRRSLFSPDGRSKDKCTNIIRRSRRSTPNKYSTPNKFSSGTIIVPATPTDNLRSKPTTLDDSEVVAETPESKLEVKKCLNTDELNSSLKLTRRGSFYSDNINKSRNWERATNRLIAEKIRGSQGDFFSDLGESFLGSQDCLGALFVSSGLTSDLPTHSPSLKKLFRPTFLPKIKDSGGRTLKGVKRLFSETKVSCNGSPACDNSSFLSPLKNAPLVDSLGLNCSPDWVTPKKRVEFSKQLVSTSKVSIGTHSPDLFHTPKGILKSPSLGGTPNRAAVSKNLSLGTPFKTPDHVSSNTPSRNLLNESEDSSITSSDVVKHLTPKKTNTRLKNLNILKSLDKSCDSSETGCAGNHSNSRDNSPLIKSRVSSLRNRLKTIDLIDEFDNDGDRTKDPKRRCSDDFARRNCDRKIMRNLFRKSN